MSSIAFLRTILQEFLYDIKVALIDYRPIKVLNQKLQISSRKIHPDHISTRFGKHCKVWVRF